MTTQKLEILSPLCLRPAAGLEDTSGRHLDTTAASNTLSVRCSRRDTMFCSQDVGAFATAPVSTALIEDSFSLCSGFGAGLHGLLSLRGPHLIIHTGSQGLLDVVQNSTMAIVIVRRTFQIEAFAIHGINSSEQERHPQGLTSKGVWTCVAFWG